MCGFDRVGRVNQIRLDTHRPVSANRPRRGFTSLGDSAEPPSRLDAVQSFKTNCNDRSQLHEPLGPAKERLVQQVTVVFVQKLVGQLQQLDADQLQSLFFEARDYFAYDSSPNRVGLD